MTTDEDVKVFTRDLQDVKVLVARLGTMQENSEKRIDTLTGVTQEAVNGMNRLSERMTATVGMEKDIAAMRDLVAEQKGDIRTIRHDLNNALNAINGITVLGEKLNESTSTIAAQGAKIENLESWRDKMDGAGVAGLSDRVSKLERDSSNKDGKESGTHGTIKVIWDAISTPFWIAVTAAATWILSGMYGGKGPTG